jgi:hypothetical protein
VIWQPTRPRGADAGSTQRARCARPALLLALAAAMLTTAARADNFANVYYDTAKDQLVVTLFYRGTNPDHRFSLKWGECKTSAD